MRVQYVPGTLWEPGNEARSNPFLTPFYAPEEGACAHPLGMISKWKPAHVHVVANNIKLILL